MSILQFHAQSCKNCYKCVRCCPVKAIEVRDHKARIIEEDCILCGTCVTVCPQNAKEDIPDIGAVSDALARGERMIVSVAPSYAAYFSTDFPTLRGALRELGFSDAFETAEGAYLVKTEYERLVHENPGKTYISSCCAAVNHYIQKMRPGAQAYLLPVLTPVQAHARLLRQRFPDARVVFLSPCVAKKGEQLAEESQYDFTLLFHELAAWLRNAGIVLPEAVGRNNADPRLSRLFPKSGGILQTMTREAGWRYLSVDGFEDCSAAVDDVLAGRMGNCFIEMNFCRGGCVGGPSFRKAGMSTAYSELKVRNSANTRDHSVDFVVPEQVELARAFTAKRVLRMPPSEAQITAVLRRMGKRDESDELNCGMCGYSTCREKAKAVVQGKAEIGMCLPYMREKAESFANTVVDLLPSPLLCVDPDLKIRQINKAACALFRIQADVVTGQPVSRLMDEYDFVSFLASGKELQQKRIYHADYSLYLEELFQLDRESGVIVVTLRDLTQEDRQRRQNLETKMQAAALADQIVDKQLRVVHEIAFLLGETAAETKTAVKDLKDAILLDEGEEP